MANARTPEAVHTHTHTHTHTSTFYWLEKLALFAIFKIIKMEMRVIYKDECI